MAEERDAGGIQVDADEVDATGDHPFERLLELLRVDVVLIEADADVLRLDLDQLGQRVLEPSADRDRAPDLVVEVGEFLAADRADRVDAGAGLVDDHVGELRLLVGRVRPGRGRRPSAWGRGGVLAPFGGLGGLANSADGPFGGAFGPGRASGPAASRGSLRSARPTAVGSASVGEPTAGDSGSSGADAARPPVTLGGGGAPSPRSDDSGSVGNLDGEAVRRGFGRLGSIGLSGAGISGSSGPGGSGRLRRGGSRPTASPTRASRPEIGLGGSSTRRARRFAPSCGARVAVGRLLARGCSSAEGLLRPRFGGRFGSVPRISDSEVASGSSPSGAAELGSRRGGWSETGGGEALGVGRRGCCGSGSPRR